ncbi:MAG: glycosyltransferase family 8 protein [Ilumatobacteraceae bacterium]
MTDDERHIVVATDEAFAMPTAVTLRSIALHGGGSATVTVLHDSVGESIRDRIARSIPDQHLTLRWVDVGDFDVRSTGTTHLSNATYFRLKAVAAVPEGVSRVVYLDTDIVVRHDLGPLFELDLAPHAIAAVQSVHYPFIATRGANNHWQELGLDPRAPFFNAGVLVIDVDTWRHDDIEHRALAHLRSPHCGKGADQEALNVAVSGAWHQLDPIWNQQTPLLDDTHGVHLIHADDQIEQARSDPAVVHFQTRPKPWQHGSSHPFDDLWWSIARDTAFAPIEVERPSLLDEARWRAKRAASALVKGR